MAHLNDNNFLKQKKKKKGKPTKRPRKKQKKNEGPAHLVLNPPHFSFVVLFPFLSLLPIDQKPCFPLEKGILFLFLLVSLCFPLAFFGLPLFPISLSLFLSFFLSFFLLVFLFCFILLLGFCIFSFSFFFVFVS